MKTPSKFMWNVHNESIFFFIYSFAIIPGLSMMFAFVFEAWCYWEGFSTCYIIVLFFIFCLSVASFFRLLSCCQYCAASLSSYYSNTVHFLSLVLLVFHHLLLTCDKLLQSLIWNFVIFCKDDSEYLFYHKYTFHYLLPPMIGR